MGKHTDGPWFATKGQNNQPEVVNGQGHLIAMVWGGSGPEAAVNARLIAGAPDMLEALKAVRDNCLFADDDNQIGVTQDPHISEFLFSEICAALNKAEPV